MTDIREKETLELVFLMKAQINICIKHNDFREANINIEYWNSKEHIIFLDYIYPNFEKITNPLLQ